MAKKGRRKPPKRKGSMAAVRVKQHVRNGRTVKAHTRRCARHN